MIQIPPKDRKEWRDLLTGQINVPLKNFFFQMKITQAKKLIEKDKLTVEDAVDELYNLCVKFSKAKYMDVDIQNIFGSNTFTNKESIEIEKTKENNAESDVLNNEEKNLINVKLQEKKERINALRMKEEAAKQQRESGYKSQIDGPGKSAKNDKLEQIRLEAQRVIQQRYEMELAKRKMKQEQERLKNKPVSKNLSKGMQDFMKMEEEKKRIQQRKKKKVVRQKKSGFGSFFRNWFN